MAEYKLFCKSVRWAILLSGFNSVRRAVEALHRRGSGAAVLLFVLECALGMIAVVLASALTSLAGWLMPVVALLYMLIVVPIALICGFWQAVIVSFTAVFFHGIFHIRQASLAQAADPVNTLTLAVFVFVALVISRLSSRVHEHARETEVREGQMSDLYEFTRRTLAMNLHIEPGAQLVELVHETFGFEAVVVFDADLHKVYQAGYWPIDAQELAQNIYHFENNSDDAETGIGCRVVRLGNAPVGSLVVRGGTSPLVNNAIASLIAVTFDRYRAFANESRIETERRTEQLRATVLDNLAHAYKTPLTAIRAASTGLSEMGNLRPEQADLIALIDEQAGLLSTLTTRLLTTARLDAGQVTLRTTDVGVASLIEEVLAGLKDRMATMKVVVEVPDEGLTLRCDRGLVSMLLTQYVDNACKYSIFGTAVTIRAERGRAEVVFSVHSYGAVIPMADRERVFDRYYRSSTQTGRASGTGIGLSVAKRAAEAHGGYVWVQSDEVDGTTFFAAIPAPRRKQ